MLFRRRFVVSAVLAILVTTVAHGRAAEDPVVAAMGKAIQDEFRAQQTYLKVIEDFGEVRPFSNIVQAETRHIAVLTALYVSRGLTAPESRWNRENVPSYETLKAACVGAVRAEIENIAMYDRLLKIELPADVKEAFEYLRWASDENHLPAFRRCVDREERRASKLRNMGGEAPGSSSSLNRH